jgi:hypothetical protein
LALDGGEWSASRPSCTLPPRKGPRYSLYRRLGGLAWPGLAWPGLDTEARGKILSPLLGIEPRSPSCPACSQTLLTELLGSHPGIEGRLISKRILKE